MTVYVDNMNEVPLGKFRRMKMSHMVADTEHELHEMADKIGVQRKWYQGDHYDICKSKRVLAVKNGAVEITMQQLGVMFLLWRRNKKKGPLPTPEEAEVYRRKYLREGKYNG